MGGVILLYQGKLKPKDKAIILMYTNLFEGNHEASCGKCTLTWLKEDSNGKFYLQNVILNG